MIQVKFLKSLIFIFLCIPLISFAQTPQKETSPLPRAYPHPIQAEIKCSTTDECTIAHPKCIGGWADSPYPINKKYQKVFLKRTKDFCASGGYGIIADGLGEGVLKCKAGQCSFGTCAQARPDKPGWWQCERYILQHPELSPKRYTEVLLNDIYDAMENFKNQCGYYPNYQEGFGALFSLKSTGSCKGKVPNEASTQAAKDLQSRVAREQFDPRKDGWSQPIDFSSNGGTYKISASHGYWVSQKSRVQKNGLHWSNLHPPKESPSFAPLCYGDLFGDNCPAEIKKLGKYHQE